MNKLHGRTGRIGRIGLSAPSAPTDHQARGWRCRLSLCLLSWLAAAAMTPASAAVTTELQQATRAATFEVVLAKGENPAITYEKPLPWDLVPFQERNDKYWSIGTAFAIGPNSFISAAHVLMQGVGSLLGEPKLRGADGTIFVIDQVLRYSADEDFIEFSLKSPPALKPLQTHREPQIDDEVLAVGNALGDGIVIRSGLYTSATPEDQDGRWKWIRFSAAASPGNSGGPLLDTQGRVIGIVIAKSENENLNFALPIKQVLDAPARQARIDTRAQFELPVMNAPVTRTLKTSFALPRSFASFATELSRINAEHYRQAIQQLLKEQATQVFPSGKGVHQLLATQEPAWFPRLVGQNDNDEWESKAPESIDRNQLPSDGFVSSGTIHGITLLRLHRPNNDSDPAIYNSSQALVDLLLRGERISRRVGRESVRITSLGPAASESLHTDRLGRIWQLRQWHLPHLDSRLLFMALPTPDGYVGMIQFINGVLLENTLTQMKEIANYVDVSYAGTRAQWQQFLSMKALLPTAIANSQLSFAKTAGNSLQWRSPRVSMNLTETAFPLDDRSELGVIMQFILDGQRLSWEPTGLNLSSEDSLKRRLLLTRLVAPDAETRREQRTRWDTMAKLEAPYDAFPRYDSSEQQYWISGTFTPTGSDSAQPVAMRNESAKVRYQLSYHTGQQLSAFEISNTFRNVQSGMRILER